MAETPGGVAVLSSFLDVAFVTMATPGYKTFFYLRKFNEDLITQLKNKFEAFSLIVDSAEEKQFIREEVRKWLLELKDATYEAEDLVDGIEIEYQAHQSNAVNRDQSEDPLKKDLEPKLQQILEKLELLMQQSKEFPLKKVKEDGSPETTETTPSFDPPQSFEFDVFLNFRGDDTRFGFVYNLKDALQETKEIKTFYDAEDLRKGEEIDKILDKIKVSKMSIMIFSRDYASSSYCLKELVTIFECKKRWGHEALPVFYHVPPDVVENQSGIYGEAFRRHGEKGTSSEEMRAWRTSLEAAAGLSGAVLENRRPEKDDIRDIVKDVKKILEDFDKKKNSQDKEEL